MRKHMAALALALSLASGAAQAGLVSYDEAVSGDLSGAGFVASNTFTFDTAGTQTVTGSASWSSTTRAFDFDFFSFIVADGLRVVSIVLASFSSVGDVETGWWLDAVSAPASTLNPSHPAIDPSLLPLTGLHYMLTSRVGCATLPTCTGAMDYTVSLVVERVPAGVPEPATFLLLGLGLAGLGAVRRRA